MMNKNRLAAQCRIAAMRAAPSVSFSVKIVGNGNNAAVCVEFHTADATAEEKTAIRTAVSNHLQSLVPTQANAFAENAADTPLFSGTAQTAIGQVYDPQSESQDKQLSLL